MHTPGESLLYSNQLLMLAKQLLIVTKEVWSYAQKSHIERVISKLKKREAIIRQLKAMEKRFARERKVSKVDAEPIMVQERLTLEAALQSIDKVLREVDKVDGGIWQFLQQEKERIASELKNVTAQNKLLTAYSADHGDPPKYFNLSI